MMEDKPRGFESVSLKELDSEQRRWLPTPIPEDLRVIRCTGCGDMQAELPGHEPKWEEEHPNSCQKRERDPWSGGPAAAADDSDWQQW